MADNNKVTIDAEPITIPAAQFSRILAAAVHCEYLMKQKHINEEKICRMRAELTRYQTICENRKRTSGAGASAEPQQTTTDADETKTDAGALAIETEGRVSGGERAGFSDIEREHYKRLEDKYIALSKERDELKAKVNAYEPKIKELDAANLDAYEKIGCLRKERDELKAKLDGDATANGLSPATQNLLETEQRLADAERRIEDIECETMNPDSGSGDTKCMNIQSIIRAWREKREAAQ